MTSTPQHENTGPNEADGDRELTHVERSWLACKFFGLYTMGMAFSDNEKIDERCAMDNMRVPFLVSHLKPEEREFIERCAGHPLPVVEHVPFPRTLIEEIVVEPDQRFPGYTSHVVPLKSCPLCGSEPNFVLSEPVWFAECPVCGLILGYPYGYASRLDLCRDWNKRHDEPR